MKIKANKRYLTRSGEVVLLTDSGGKEWPFNGSNGLSYDRKGRFLQGTTTSHDLEMPFSDLARTFKSSSFWWWVCGFMTLVVLVMLCTHWGPVFFSWN